MMSFIKLFSEQTVETDRKQRNRLFTAGDLFLVNLLPEFDSSLTLVYVHCLGYE